MEKKRYTRPQYTVIEVGTSMMCASETNSYDPKTESGFIRTNTTAVDASQAEVKKSSGVKWDNWE